MFLTHLRPARLEDCADIHSAHEFSVRYACEHYYDDNILQAWLSHLSINSYIEAIKTRTVWVIEYKNHIQGFFQLNLSKSELDALYVHPFVHRQGLGTAMLQKAEQIAFNSGLGFLKLYASLNSVRFYEINGYQKISDYDIHLSPQVSVQVALMRKYLHEDEIIY
ncbi:MAG: GNAT family N-acetyltransferase [Neisseriaceae bacterium]|nr:GNAT family N-acetyltransferase [Neisseriaceae bacterium]MBQ9183691.1 GNAT family N-acetyltransferase [Neisseriaceae bacterium]MBQ9725278.1 GNAT family N-acetyltransferase [Neisseriaceae bacterium]MBR0129127.1 GNAT family N-acetyltransferase [Neisseriaceae bacterium]MBR1818580.1 GNAT family N-acetyltransferase [Neisseriaceae bacterium]